jgi:hypothetical protein
MVNIIGINAFSSGVVLQEWWQYTLVAIVSVSGLIGIIALLWSLYNAIKKLVTVSACPVPIPRMQTHHKISRRAKTRTFYLEQFKNGFINSPTPHIASDQVKRFSRSHRHSAYTSAH